MKKFTLFLFVILSGLMLSSFTVSKTHPSLIEKSHKIEVIFNNKTNFKQLVQIQKQLHKRNIDLVYKELEFDENNGLIKIDFKVNCNDGFKGSAASDHLTNNSMFGFFRDYSKGAKSPFGTGGLD